MSLIQLVLRRSSFNLILILRFVYLKSYSRNAKFLCFTSTVLGIIFEYFSKKFLQIIVIVDV